MKRGTIRRGAAIALSLFMMINSITGQSGLMVMTSYADAERAGQVDATVMNVRSGPGTTYSIVDKLTNGASVTVLGEQTGEDGQLWYGIRFTGSSGLQTVGYARSDYICFPASYTSDMDFEAYLTAENFPESYKPGLRQLHAMYPNWVFRAQQTGLEWDTVIENESLVGRNLVYGGNISSWKSTADGAYDWETGNWPVFDSGSYVAASPAIIRYYMDPRNFLDDKYVFQFLLHTYDSSAQTAAGLLGMVKGTFLGGEVDVSSEFYAPRVQDGPNSGVIDIPYTAPPSVASGSGGENDAGGPQSSPGGGSETVPSGSPAESGGVGLGAPGASVSAGGSGGRLLGAPGTLWRTDQILLSLSSGAGPDLSQNLPQGLPSGDAVLEGPSAGGDPSVSAGPPVSDSDTVDMQEPGVPSASTSGSGSSSASSGGTAPKADYVSILMNVAAQTGVNPYVLAAIILQEQGNQGTGGSISGTISGYEGYYNFFNVEAYKSGSMSAVERGLWYASQSGSYGRPWNSVDKSILGGAQHYAVNYVQLGQDTFYLKKFNVQGTNLYKHQYMTNIQAAAAEGAKLAEAYGDELKQEALVFKIPVYLNMPETACPRPAIDGSPNNKLSGLTVEGYTLTPTFSRDTNTYDLIVDGSVSGVTVSATAYDAAASISGTGTVALAVGVNEVRVSVKAQNGDIREYLIRIVRQQDSGTAGPGGEPGAETQAPGAAGPGGEPGAETQGPGTAGPGGEPGAETQGPGSGPSVELSGPEGSGAPGAGDGRVILEGPPLTEMPSGQEAADKAGPE